MKAILTNSKTGEIAIHEIPQPELQAGGILVETRFSVVSSGTERAKIETGEKSLLGKARARPDLVRQVVDYARANGVRAAYEKVKARLDTLAPLGYSCSGVVLEVGEGVTEFRLGDRVACAGAGFANHSEVNFIPRNLAVRVPEAVPLEHAAITTIGAIALQGLRQAEVRLGETVVVIGAGLIGVLAVQLAKAAGCRAVAVDIDRQRVERAIELGAQAGFVATDPQVAEQVAAFSRYGADAAVITAATRSSEPLELAVKLLRDRGRIVVVGDVGLAIARGPLYNKELSLALSRSYGPGRYDPVYEDRGVDYPIGYVRWTEQRNMEAFLDALASSAVNVAPLLDVQRPIAEAPQAYEDMRQSGAYTVLIRYPMQSHDEQRPQREESASKRAGQARESVRIGCIGAGNFARGTIFPQLRKIPGVVMEAVATASGVAAESARTSAGFHRAAAPADRRGLANVGRLELGNLFLAAKHGVCFLWLLATKRPSIVYVPVSQAWLPFLRDCLFLIPARIFGRRVVIHLHGGYFGRFYRETSPLMRWIIRCALGNAACAIVLGHKLADAFNGVLPASRIRVIPNGIPGSFAKLLPKKTGSHGPRVLYLSTLTAEKGFLDLLQALPKVIDRVGDLRAVFAGEWYSGHDRDMAEQLIQRLGLHHVVEFVGPVGPAEKHKLLEGADLLAFPTAYRFEGHPYVILEAMSAGLPVISTNVACIPETIRNGVEGFLVEPGDTETLAERIGQVLSDESLRVKLGQATLRRFFEEYTFEKFAERIKVVFTEVLRSASAEPTEG